MYKRQEERHLTEDTIVIFSADNGMSMGQHGIWGKGNGTFPMNMYESAVKVPFIISWPCFIKPGSVCCELVSAYDLFPTLLELTGLSGRFPEGLPGTVSYTHLDVYKRQLQCGAQSGKLLRQRIGQPGV